MRILMPTGIHYSSATSVGTIEILDHNYGVNPLHGTWYYAILVRDEYNFYHLRKKSCGTLNFVEYSPANYDLRLQNVCSVQLE